MARDMHDTADDGAGWEELAPLLDEGLNKLGAGERDALLLKYFEKKSLRQVGEALGISEDAATKRVSRAVERLRVFFQRRGTVVSAIALTNSCVRNVCELPWPVLTRIDSGNRSKWSGCVNFSGFPPSPNI